MVPSILNIFVFALYLLLRQAACTSEWLNGTLKDQGLQPRTFHFSAQTPTAKAMAYVLNWTVTKSQIYSNYSLKVQSIAHSPCLQNHCLFISPLAFLLHPHCASVHMLKLNPSRAV